MQVTQIESYEASDELGNDRDVHANAKSRHLSLLVQEVLHGGVLRA